LYLYPLIYLQNDGWGHQAVFLAPSPQQPLNKMMIFTKKLYMENEFLEILFFASKQLLKFFHSIFVDLTKILSNLVEIQKKKVQKF
jgi:hypothetical protein